MAATSNNTAVTASTDEATVKAAQKRYEGLVMVRNKAIKGKGAWYWAHLEPLLVHNADTGLPKAVKLRCSLCDAVFSASNPSRTASEHLKRGTCPNFNASIPKPISSISPSPPQPSAVGRKRSAVSSPSPLTVVDPSRFAGEAAAPLPHHHHLHHQHQQHLVLSGGKDDLGHLAMLEDSVKKLKSPKTSPGPALSKTQIESAVDYLADWVYESCGSVSVSSLEHPKFRSFLHQVGLPPVSKRDLAGGRLDVKFEEAKAESEARIRDAMFFQLSSDGWKSDEPNLVNLAVNLPNGTSIYRRAVFMTGSVGSTYAEDVLWDTVKGICGNFVQQCAGIVADRFKAKALRNLENRHHWMVNLCCQLQGFRSLIKDLSKELPLFKSAADNCYKLANVFNNQTQFRNSLNKYQLQEYGYSGLIRVPFESDFMFVFSMIDDVLNNARAVQLVLMDESLSMEEPESREVAEMVEDVRFWNELEAVHSLVKVITDMVQEMEAERPLIGKCLPLWEGLGAKVKEWCAKFGIGEVGLMVEKVIERRFEKNYHPAMAAAYILDPLYLVRDTSGKYLPPFKYLTPDQEKDVDRLITRLVSREEAHIVLMELMKWRTEGLDPVYARAVQMKERDPVTGKMRLSNPQSSRLVWETHLTEFKSLGKVAVRLIFLHATACGFKCNASLLRWVSGSHGSQSGAAIDKAQKLVFIAAHSKLERRDFSNDEDKDAELFGMGNEDDDVLNEVLADTSSV
ncbi:hypothetical protein LINPERPRIM_LOCUS9960 [Linum perenne]